MMTSALTPLMNANIPLTTVILGTHPSKFSLALRTPAKDSPSYQRWATNRGGIGAQNYGNPNNCFWSIMGSALGFHRNKTTYLKQVQMFEAGGLTHVDVIASCSYANDSSLDRKINMNSIQRFELLQFITDHPTIQTLVAPYTTAVLLQHPKLFGDILRGTTPNLHNFTFVICTEGLGSDKTKKTFARSHQVKLLSRAAMIKLRSQHRLIELRVVPSTSPASTLSTPAFKEYMWHGWGLGLEQPPETYRCSACSKTGDHWIYECTMIKQIDGCSFQGYQLFCKERFDATPSASHDLNLEGDRWLFRKPHGTSSASAPTMCKRKRTITKRTSTKTKQRQLTYKKMTREKKREQPKTKDFRFNIQQRVQVKFKNVWWEGKINKIIDENYFDVIFDDNSICKVYRAQIYST